LNASDAHFIELSSVARVPASGLAERFKLARSGMAFSHAPKKNAPGGNFLLHGGAVGPISQLTRREKKPDEAAPG
jgi:hypothetical protein